MRRDETRQENRINVEIFNFFSARPYIVAEGHGNLMASLKARHVLQLRYMPLCILLYAHKYGGRNIIIPDLKRVNKNVSKLLEIFKLLQIIRIEKVPS